MTQSTTTFTEAEIVEMLARMEQPEGIRWRHDDYPRLVAIARQLLTTITERDSLRQFVADTSEGFECLPECDSAVHAELCPLANPVAAWRMLRTECDSLAGQLKDTRASQGSVYGADWENWKAANARIKELEAERDSLRAELKFANEAGYDEATNELIIDIESEYLRGKNDALTAALALVRAKAEEMRQAARAAKSQPLIAQCTTEMAHLRELEQEMEELK